MKLSLIFLLNTILTKELTLPNREFLTSINKNTSTNYNFGITGKIISENDKEEELNFKIDFQYSKSIMGQKEKIDWGINCEENNKNGCVIIDVTEKENKYFGSEFFYRDSSFTFNFLNENPKDFGSYLDCQLISQVKNKWNVEDNWGVMGMGPQSDFKNYIIKNSKKNVSILFDLTTSKKDKTKNIEKINIDNKKKVKSSKKIDEGVNKKIIIDNIQESLKKDKVVYENLNFEMKLFLNPLIVGDDNIYFQFMTDKKTWDINTSIKIKDETFNKYQDFCITSNNPQILYTQNYIELKEKLFFEICGKKDHCPENFSDITKASNIEFMFANKKEVIFTYEDFTYIENEEIKLRIEDIKILHDNGECLNYQNGLGLLFFKNTKLILTFLKNGNTSLSLTNEYTFYTNEVYFIYYVIGFLVLLVTSILVYFCYLDTKKDGIVKEEENLLVEN